MDNLTHSLVGLAMAKAGLERVSPCATAVCIIGANLPDADIVAGLWGSWVYLEHHRGITHSIVGTVLLALLLPTAFWAGDALFALWRRRERRVRLAGLLLASSIALASHPLLDWTNSYGVRPLLPWSAEWFYGDIVFILDPWLWLSIGGAAFLLTARTARRVWAWALLCAVITLAIIALPPQTNLPYPLASRVLWAAGVCGLVAAHRFHLAARWGSALAITALALIVVYWAALGIAHRRAYMNAEQAMKNLMTEAGEHVQKLAATPALADPLRWRCLAETNRATYRFDLRLGGAGELEDVRRYEKLPGEEAVLSRAVNEDKRAGIFLGFARFPVARVERNCVAGTILQLADLRFTEPGQSERGNFGLQVSLPDGSP